MTTIDKGPARLEADFNSVRDGETLVARFDFSGGASLPSPYERIELYDGEGNRCYGVVVEAVGDEHFRVRPLWDTWIDAEDANETPADGIDMVAALRASLPHAGETKASEVEEFTPTVG